MRDFSLKHGDNCFWIIMERDNYFLSMRYRDEAEVVVNKLNSLNILCESMVQYGAEKDDEIKNLHRKLWKLRQQLQEHDIIEECE